jgi:hypothetical protein
VSSNVGRVALARPHVVQRRVGAQPTVLVGVAGVGVAGVAVVGDPGPPDREEVEAQHVEHADAGNAGAEQLGVLGEAGADQQATVRAAGDRDPAGP